jgi:UDP-3-O-[3-hydroxymyristoyl] glucosamine N-acyltransferase
MCIFKNRMGSEIARVLGLAYAGADVLVKDIRSARNLKPNALTFAKKESVLVDILKSEIRPLVVVTTEDSLRGQRADKASNIGIIVSKTPRLTFVRAMNLLLDGQDKKPAKSFIHPTAIIEKDVRIGDSTHVSAHVYIGPNTKVGDNVVIHPNVTIYGDTSIGRNVTIHSGTVIGKPGFGFEKDENGSWIMFPHIGRVIIEDDVVIGGNNAVDRGALEDTVIGSGTKTDNLVHIGHGVKIGKNCILTACVQTSGSIIGDNTWIGPNSSMIQNLRIGRNCLAGVGSVIIRNIPDNTTVAGNPAVPIDELKKVRAALRTLVSSK